MGQPSHNLIVLAKARRDSLLRWPPLKRHRSQFAHHGYHRRQGQRKRGRRQYALVAVLYAHGLANAGGADICRRYVGGDQIAGR